VGWEENVQRSLLVTAHIARMLAASGLTTEAPGKQAKRVAVTGRRTEEGARLPRAESGCNG